MKLFKKISKYIMNFLAMTNAVIVALAPVYNWNVDKLCNVLVIVDGLVGTWLVSGKLFETKE